MTVFFAAVFSVMFPAVLSSMGMVSAVAFLMTVGALMIFPVTVMVTGRVICR